MESEAPRNPDVFVSYATKDGTKIAGELVRSLEDGGLTCWIAPRDIKLGELWPEKIPAAIASSHALLLLLTQHANTSRQVLREVNIGDDASRPLLPVVMPGVTPEAGFKYFLSTAQQLVVESTIDAAVTEQIRGRLAELLEEGTRKTAESRTPPATLAALSKPSDATLWRVYASSRSRLVLLAFYGASMLLPRIAQGPLEDWLDVATRALAVIAGTAIVGVTRQLNLPVLFTIGLVQPVFMLLPLALEDFELVLRSLRYAPPVPYGLLCAGGGLVMSLRFGVPKIGALSLSTWRAWIAPAWSVLRRHERLESIGKILAVGAALLLLAYNLRR
jgi:hypothetical protein